jgi:hypothetical protein
MERPFLIEEIMLEGVSGAVWGKLQLDAFSGLIEQIDCQAYAFRRDDTDRPIVLSHAQRAAAKAVVHRVLESQIDRTDAGGLMVASGDSFSPLAATSEGTGVLAEYLKGARPRESAGQGGQARRAQ